MVQETMDISGEKIGRIEVVRCEGYNENGDRMYRIRCIYCGEEALRAHRTILRIKKFKCKCIDEFVIKRSEQMEGMIFGDFELVKLVKHQCNRNFYLMRCTTCGFTEVVRRDRLENRLCINHRPNIKLTGRMSGMMKEMTQEERYKILDERYKGKIYGDLRIDGLAIPVPRGKSYYYCTCLRCEKSGLVVRLDGIKEHGRTSTCDCRGRREKLDIKPQNIIPSYQKIIDRNNTVYDETHQDSDLTGKVFGSLQVSGYSHVDSLTRDSMWKCLCLNQGCQNYTIVSRTKLISREVTQCERCQIVQETLDKERAIEEKRKNARCPVSFNYNYDEYLKET